MKLIQVHSDHIESFETIAAQSLINLYYSANTYLFLRSPCRLLTFLSLFLFFYFILILFYLFLSFLSRVVLWFSLNFVRINFESFLLVLSGKFRLLKIVLWKFSLTRRYDRKTTLTVWRNIWKIFEKEKKRWEENRFKVFDCAVRTNNCSSITQYE